MSNKILIPIDFTVQSLNVLKVTLQNFPEVKFDVILIHGLHNSDSIRDLLFGMKHKQLTALSNKEFEEAFEIIQNKFKSQISSIVIDLFSGYNQSAFNNYLITNQISQIVMSNQKPKLSHRRSFDLGPFIKKSAIQTIIIDTSVNVNLPEKGKLAEVFFNQVSVG